MSFVPIATIAVRLPTVPVKLDREIELQRQRSDQRLTRPVTSKDDLAAAHAFLVRYEKDRAESPTIPEVRGLIGLYTEPGADPVVCANLARVLALAPGVPARRIFMVWQLRGPGFNTLAQALGYALSRAQKPPAWRPAWLGVQSGAALLKPEPMIARWLAEQAIPFHTLSSARLGVSITVGVGEAAVREAVINGSSQWWALSPPGEARATGHRAGHKLRIAVADRQLRELGRMASNAAELPPRDNESDALTQWCLHHFRAPWDAPGVWQEFSPRAREVMEWLLLRDEFARIIEEFRTLAEYERAEFWPEYLSALRDARFYRTSDGIAVCMMVFESCMAIEFGITGNAAYLYAVPQIRLRSSALPTGLDAKAFKDRYALTLGGLSVSYLESWSHNGAWQPKFRRRLAHFGVSYNPRRGR